MTSPPCQAFSLAGKRLGKDDKRGILFFNSHEFIQLNKPRFFIFENVKGLLSDDEGKTFQEWINMLGGKSVNGVPVLFPYDDSVPYHLYWQVLNAKHHGVPQNRERVFLIGIRDDADNKFQFPREEHLPKRLKDVLESNVDKKYDVENISNIKRLSETLAKHELPNDIRMIDSYNKSIHEDSICISTRINASSCTHLWDTKKIRRLTPRDCFRIMDFPDTFTWKVSDSQAYKQAGNSIVVNVLYKILKQLPL
jgi:DNA (cytosine-5)-methyltransferase 1